MITFIKVLLAVILVILSKFGWVKRIENIIYVLVLEKVCPVHTKRENESIIHVQEVLHCT